jgi:PAS domain S-box-containing protein
MPVFSRIDRDALFNASPNPYMLLDRAFTIVWMNDAYLAATGSAREDIVGRYIFDAFPSDPASLEHRQLLESFERAFATRERDHVPLIRYDIPRPDGSDEARWWSATHTPLFDTNGEVAYVLQHTVEVTELQRLRAAANAPADQSTYATQVEGAVLRRALDVEETSRALLEERDHLRRLFEQAPGFMAVLSGPTHVFTLANAAYTTLIGRADVLGKPVAEALPEVRGQGFVELLDSVFTTGEPYVGRAMRIVLEHADGAADERFLDFVYQPILERDGRVAGIFVQGHDITDQKTAERALSESEQRFRLVAESAPVMLWMSTVDGRCLYLNKAQRKFWGVAPDAVASFDWGGTIHPDDRDAVSRPLVAAMREQRPFSVEGRYRRADGDWRLLHTDARPRFGPDDSFQGMIGVNVDVTEMRRAEQALQELNATLERQVAERTEQLRQNEERLRQVVKLEAIGRLTGGVAHDFNNLLQVIGGNLQLLAKELAGDDRAGQRLRNALAGVARGSKLAAQLLAYGRRQALAPKTVNLGRLVRSVDEMLRRALGEGIEIETAIAGGLWNTFVDPGQVEDALLNLAINARDAMEGQGKLTLEAGNAWLDDAYAATHDVTAGQYVMLAVTDTGSGMSPEVIEQAFEPFFSTKPEGQGTGLGLSQVYGFVKQSGGHVKIYSEVGHGTTIRLYLPRSRREEDVVTDVDAGPVAGGSETILVVEDDETVRETVVEMLADLGYRVLKAKDAESALSVLSSGVAIDLLFTDVVMPGTLRSPELARIARERRPGIAVLFTSGYTENAIVHGGRLDEGVDLLSKPYTREALARRLRDALRRAGRPDPAAVSDGAGRPGATPRAAAAAAGSGRQSSRADGTAFEQSVEDATFITGPDGIAAWRGSDGTAAPQGSDGAVAPRIPDGAAPAPGADGTKAPGGNDGAEAPRGADGAARPSKDKAAFLDRADGASAPRGGDGLAGAPAYGAASAGGADEVPSLRVLVVEDDIIIRMSTVDLLAGLGHAVLEAGDAHEALAVLEREPVDVLITDIGLPGTSGGTLAVEASRRIPGLGIVFASGRDALPPEAAELPPGRTVLLRKPYDLRRLAEALVEARG